MNYRWGSSREDLDDATDCTRPIKRRSWPAHNLDPFDGRERQKFDRCDPCDGIFNANPIDQNNGLGSFGPAHKQSGNGANASLLGNFNPRT